MDGWMDGAWLFEEKVLCDVLVYGNVCKLVGCRAEMYKVDQIHTYIHTHITQLSSCLFFFAQKFIKLIRLYIYIHIYITSPVPLYSNSSMYVILNDKFE